MSRSVQVEIIGSGGVPPAWARPLVALVKVLAVFLVWPLAFVLLLPTLLMEGLEWLIDEWYGGGA